MAMARGLALRRSEQYARRTGQKSGVRTDGLIAVM
jgi:hypothetical protein